MNGAYRGVRVLVLGASGFLGGWVVRMLSREGATTHAIVRDQSAIAAVRMLGATSVTTADLTATGAVAAVVRDAAPAITFNLVGYGVDHGERNPAMMPAVNTILVSHLCEAIKALPEADGWRGLRLVHAGSALEYGRVEGAITEDTELRPDTEYGRTKLAATQAVLRSAHDDGVRAAVARLFTVYGPGEHAGRLLSSLMLAARAGTTVSLTSGRQPRDFTFVEDVAEAMLRMGCAGSAAGLVLNVATGRLTSVRQFADTAATVLGLPQSHLRFGEVQQQPGEMFHGPVSTVRLERVLGWRPETTIEEGVRRTWQFGSDVEPRR